MYVVVAVLVITGMNLVSGEIRVDPMQSRIERNNRRPSEMIRVVEQGSRELLVLSRRGHVTLLVWHLAQGNQ